MKWITTESWKNILVFAMDDLWRIETNAIRFNSLTSKYILKEWVLRIDDTRLSLTTMLSPHWVHACNQKSATIPFFRERIRSRQKYASDQILEHAASLLAFAEQSEMQQRFQKGLWEFSNDFNECAVFWMN